VLGAPDAKDAPNDPNSGTSSAGIVRKPRWERIVSMLTSSRPLDVR